MRRWTKLQHDQQAFRCFGGNDVNNVEVIGALVYTSTIVFLVILIPVTYILKLNGCIRNATPVGNPRQNPVRNKFSPETKILSGKNFVKTLS